MRKTTILTIFLVFLGILPAMAIGEVWTDFQSYAQDLKDYLSSSVPNTLAPLDYESVAELDSSLGDLSIPDPVVAGKNVGEDAIAKSISSTFENNPAIQGTISRNEITRQISLGAAEGVLGANGQLRGRLKLQDAQEGLDHIKKFEQSANDAEANCEDILTQLVTNIENTVAAAASSGASSLGSSTPTIGTGQSPQCLQFRSIIIQSEQARMIAETLASTEHINQSLQYSNLNLANISQQIEEENRARRVDASTEAARLLRTASQADLLVGKNQDTAVGNQQ
ncbi:MAG: hypothetical protein PUP91_17750 [Rhizonema sp. PD37]|nr:hypothetical protein [Rhizonema sp. PD37]